LHGSLPSSSRAACLSLNEYCVRRLAVQGTGLASDQGALQTVTAASSLFGDALLAVIVYGSWLRGEAVATSDVDVLVVVEPRMALTRALYRAWDAAPVVWQGRRVDPHFVHPPQDRVAGGVWAEVAVAGVVVFERGWRISARLVDIRHEIAAGKLVRRLVHGQPYWTVAA
ncbi:MAG: nucleotidyltransferase domain-containing protein, partial [Acidobacteriota bacterium]